jgi:hypothetical protein
MKYLFIFRAESYGANISSASYIRDNYGGWDLVSQVDVEADTTLLEIPVAVTVHGNNVTNHPVVGPLFAYAKSYVHKGLREKGLEWLKHFCVLCYAELLAISKMTKIRPFMELSCWFIT